MPKDALIDEILPIETRAKIFESLSAANLLIIRPTSTQWLALALNTLTRRFKSQPLQLNTDELTWLLTWYEIALDKPAFTLFCQHLSLEQIQSMIPIIFSIVVAGDPDSYKPILYNYAMIDNLLAAIASRKIEDRIAIGLHIHHLVEEFLPDEYKNNSITNADELTIQLTTDLQFLQNHSGMNKSLLIFACAIMKDNLKQAQLRTILDSIGDSNSRVDYFIRYRLLQNFIPHFDNNDLDRYVSMYEEIPYQFQVTKPLLTLEHASHLASCIEEERRRCNILNEIRLTITGIHFAQDEEFDFFLNWIMQRIVNNPSGHARNGVYRDYPLQFWKMISARLIDDPRVDIYLDFFIDIIDFWHEANIGSCSDLIFKDIINIIADLQRLMNPSRVKKLTPILTKFTKEWPYKSRLGELYGFVMLHGDEEMKKCWLRADALKFPDDERNHLRYPIIKLITNLKPVNQQQADWFLQLIRYELINALQQTTVCTHLFEYITLFKNTENLLTPENHFECINLLFEVLMREKIHALSRNQDCYHRLKAFSEKFAINLTNQQLSDIHHWLIYDLRELQKSGLTDIDYYTTTLDIIDASTLLLPFLSNDQSQQTLTELLTLADSRLGDLETLTGVKIDLVFQEQFINLITLMLIKWQNVNYDHIINTFHIHDHVSINLHQRFYTEHRLHVNPPAISNNSSPTLFAISAPLSREQPSNSSSQAPQVASSSKL